MMVMMMMMGVRRARWCWTAEEQNRHFQLLRVNWVQNFPKNDDGRHQKSTKLEKESER